jgi:hypothetical protein
MKVDLYTKVILTLLLLVLAYLAFKATWAPKEAKAQFPLSPASSMGRYQIDSWGTGGPGGFGMGYFIIDTTTGRVTEQGVWEGKIAGDGLKLQRRSL